MAVAQITKRSVEALKPGSTDQFLWDTVKRGFGVKVTPTGRKIFIVQYRMGGRGSPTRRYTIGEYGVWTPTQADEEAGRILRKIDTGIDPLEEKRDREERRRTDAALAFGDYADNFLKLYVKPEWAKSYGFAESILRLHVTPRLKSKPLPSIRKSDITGIFDALPSAKPALRRNVYAVVRRLFNWAEGRGDIERNPLNGFEAPASVTSRDRVLEDWELRLAWLASAELGAPFSSLYRLLAITGQRRDEVAEMDWKELSRADRLWTLPGSRTKNGKPHLVHLSDLAMAELDALAGVADEDEDEKRKWPKAGFVFTTTGKTAVSGFSRAKSRLDTAMLDLARKEAKEAGDDPEKVKVAPWRVHDLRRTLVTGMQRLGVRFEVTEAVVNHLSGSKSGVAGVYQRYEWQDEKKAALDAWGRHLGSILSPAAESNVVKFARGAGGE